MNSKYLDILHLYFLFIILYCQTFKKFTNLESFQMAGRIIKLWKSHRFQGNLNRCNSNYFEGWYYKLVDETGKYMIAFIPGVHLTTQKQDSHAFIQILNGVTNDTYYFRYHLSDINTELKHELIKIGNSSFGLNHLQINIHDDRIHLSGEITLSELVPWPKNFLAPNSMGWYAYMPFMECYHSVLSMHHKLSGEIVLNSKSYDFTNGNGYLEKDWGKSFPSSYVWIQTNHFEKPDMSLFVSIANIPWLGRSFRGFIIGLLFSGKVYRLTTYTGAKIKKLTVDPNFVSFTVDDGKHRLEVSGERNSGGILSAPYESDMVNRISESLNSKINLKFYKIRNKKTIPLYEGQGKPAAVEIHGKLEELQSI